MRTQCGGCLLWLIGFRCEHNGWLRVTLIMPSQHAGGHTTPQRTAAIAAAATATVPATDTTATATDAADASATAQLPTQPSSQQANQRLSRPAN